MRAIVLALGVCISLAACASGDSGPGGAAGTGAAAAGGSGGAGSMAHPTPTKACVIQPGYTLNAILSCDGKVASPVQNGSHWYECDMIKILPDGSARIFEVNDCIGTLYDGTTVLCYGQDLSTCPAP